MNGEDGVAIVIFSATFGIMLSFISGILCSKGKYFLFWTTLAIGTFFVGLAIGKALTSV